MKWISVRDQLPTKMQQENNWKFLVCHEYQCWTDTAYYNEDDKTNLWNNGECVLTPTHWQPLPQPHDE